MLVVSTESVERIWQLCATVISQLSIHCSLHCDQSRPSGQRPQLINDYILTVVLSADLMPPGDRRNSAVNSADPTFRLPYVS